MLLWLLVLINVHEIIAPDKTCTPKATLQNCNLNGASADAKWIWYRDTTYKIISDFEKGCRTSTLKFYWTLQRDGSSDIIRSSERSSFYIQKYSLDFGGYIARFVLTEIEQNKVTTSDITVNCYVKIEGLPPTAIIKGGHRRNVPPLKPIHFAGYYSRDNDQSGSEKKRKLKYKWTCSSTNQITQKFCDKGVIAEAEEFRLEEAIFIDGSQTVIKLHVTSMAGKSDEATQTLIVKEKTASIYVSCYKNCDRVGYQYSNDNMDILLRFYCDINCPKKKEWSAIISHDNKIIQLPKKPREYLNSEMILEIPQDFVAKKMNEPKGEYFVRIYLAARDEDNDKTSMVEFRILMTELTSKKAESVNCVVNPRSGTTSTLFNVQCTGLTTSGYTYLFYIRQEDSFNIGTLLATSKRPEASIYLTAYGEKKQIVVKIRDEDANNIKKYIDVTVTSDIPSALSLKLRCDEIMKLFKGMRGMMKPFQVYQSRNDVERITQLSSIILTETNNLRYMEDPHFAETFSIDIKKKIFTGLETFPMLGDFDYLHFISMAQKLAMRDYQSANPVIQSSLGLYCLKAAEVLNEQANFYVYKTKRQIEAAAENDYFFECAEDCFKHNFVSSPIKKKTTKSPQKEMIGEVQGHEDVEDYAELDFNDAKSQFSIATTASIKVLELCGKQQAKTIDALENNLFTKESKEKNMFIKISTKKVKDFSENEIKLKNSVAIKMGTTVDFIGSTVLSTMTVKFAQENHPFWWDDDVEFISTDVVHVNVYGGRNDDIITNLGQDVEILFDIHKRTDMEPLNGTLVIPQNKSKWVDDALDYKIDVHRADLIVGSNIQFRVECKKKLKIVLIPNRRPVYKDFVNAIMPDNFEEIRYTPTEKFKIRDFWLYIGVFPEDSAFNDTSLIQNGNLVLDYKLHITSHLCRFWDWKLMKFSSEGCSVAKDSSQYKIHCLCNHLTTFVGMIKRFDANYRNVLFIDHVLPLQHTAVSLYFIIGLYCLYFFCITIGSTQTRKTYRKNKTVFLSDNMKDDRYAYLIVINTGLHAQSGTTSNITVKLNGEDHESKAHVLNYPDPNKRYLQLASDDYFLLTTERHLGEIKSIELWTDAVGLRPDWNCDSIKVVDLQNNNMYYFKIKKWLTVLNINDRYTKAQPYTVEEEEKDEANQTKWGKIKEILVRNLGEFSQSSHTFNILTTSHSEDLTFMQKCNIVLSIILTTMFLTLVFIGLPRFRYADALGVGHVRVSASVIGTAILSSFLSYLIHIGIHLMFRYSNEQDEEGKFSEETKQKFNIYAWILLISLIVTNTSLILMFGPWVSLLSSFLWQITVIIGLGVTIVFFDNVYRYILCLIFTKAIKIQVVIESFQQLIKEIEFQRLVLYSKFGDFLLRPYLRGKYYPLDLKKAYKRQQLVLRKLDLSKLLKDLLIFMVYAGLIFYLVLADRDHLIVVSNAALKKMLRDGDHVSKAIALHEIESHADIYTFLNGTIIETIHPTDWYGNWDRIFPGVMNDFCTILLGTVQVRQLRVKPDQCNTPKAMQYLNISCNPDWRPEYNSISHEKTDYGRLAYIWNMESGEQTGSVSKAGLVTTYPPSGFIIYLGRNKVNSYYNFMYLKENNWIDFYTRAIFIEFWAYNPNNNLFHAVRILLECAATGYIHTKIEISSVRLIVGKGSTYYIEMCCSTLLLLINIRQLITHAKKVYQNYRGYLSNIWHFMDIIIVLMSIATFGLHHYDQSLTENLLKRLDTAKNNEFVAFWPTFSYNRAVVFFSAFLILLIVLRLWKFLRFFIMFQIMERTLARAIFPLAIQFLMHMIILITFALTGMLLFSNYKITFNTVKSSLMNLALMNLNLEKHINWLRIVNLEPVLGYIYYVLCMIISVGMLNMYIVIIVSTHIQNMKEHSIKEVYGMAQYLTEELKFLKHSFVAKVENARLRGGGNRYKEKLAKPKKTEIRYANTRGIPSLKVEHMNGIAQGIIINHLREKETELELEQKSENIMRKIAITICKRNMTQYIRKDRKECFFKTYEHVNAKNHLKLIADERLREMEFIVNKILVVKDALNPDVPVPTVSLLDRFRVMKANIESVRKVLMNIKVVPVKKKVQFQELDEDYDQV